MRLFQFAASILSGAFSVMGGIFFAVIAGALWVRGWHSRRRREEKLGVQAYHILLGGLAGSWLFVTVTIGAAAWMLWTGKRSPVQALPTMQLTHSHVGPIAWNEGFSIEGPLQSRVFSLRFSGVNISKTKALQLKKANIISGIDGTLLPLEIVATSAEDKSEIVPINKIKLIPPGARIELVAKFGDPDPKVPKNILGLDPKTFLDRWRQFSFNVEDDVRTYQINYDDRSMMVFFHGKVGPRVTMKPELPK